MKIKKVAVLGAGAVGSYVIWGLSNNKDIELGVISTGERRERLKRKGCIINGVKYTPKARRNLASGSVNLQSSATFTR